MGPFLDIYGLTNRRDRETIEGFLNAYADRAALEDMGDSELMILRMGKNPEEATSDADWEWEPMPTLTQAIQRGLDYPRRVFTLYLSPVLKKPAEHLILSFTTDDRLVIGLSVQYWRNCSEQLLRAKKLLKGLVADFDCSMGLIGVEHPPPLSIKEFRKTIDTRERTLHVWQRETGTP